MEGTMMERGRACGKPCSERERKAAQRASALHAVSGSSHVRQPERSGGSRSGLETTGAEWRQPERSDAPGWRWEGQSTGSEAGVEKETPSRREWLTPGEGESSAPVLTMGSHGSVLESSSSAH